MSVSHYLKIVLPAVREYNTAEQKLTDKFVSKEDISELREEVLRRSRTVAMELNHLTDHYMNQVKTLSIDQVRSQLLDECYYLRRAEKCEDTKLIRDIADAFKHEKLSRPSSQVSNENQVLTIGKVFGEGPCGEGKYGGVPEARVVLNSRKPRAFSTIVQNSVDAWRRVLGINLPPIRDFQS